MAKSREAFRTISEVAEWLDTPAHVLRFWESKFSQIKPVKRAGGRRYYRPADMALIGGIKQLLHVDGMTIKGVQKILREQGVKHVASLSAPLDEALEPDAAAPAAKSTPAPAEEPRVVPFQARAKPEPVPEPAPEPEAEAPAPVPAPETATPAPGPAASDPPDIPAPAEAAPAPAPSAPELPGFLQPDAATAPGEESPDGLDEPAASPAPQMPVVAAKVPDDPADDIAAAPGLLARVAQMRAVDPARAGELAATLDRLRGLRDRIAAQR